jgi:uncharacterized protein YxeA
MKIKVEDLQRALDFYRKNGNPTEVEVELDQNLQARMLLKGTCNEDLVTVTLFDVSVNMFPKRTVTERL